MATAVGSFAKPTGTGGEQHSVTSIGATPKFLLLWTNGLTSSNAFVIDQNLRTSKGWSNGTTHHCLGSYSQDAANPTDTYRVARASALVGITAAGTVEWEATALSFTSTGFTLTFGTNNATATLINWMAIYGSLLTDVALTTFSVPNAAGEFNAVTGLSFQPTCMLLMGNGVEASALPTAADHDQECFGLATGASNQLVAGMRARDALSTTATQRLHYNNRVYGSISPTASSIQALLSFVQFNADGVRLNATDVTGNTPGDLVLCALLRGGSWHSGELVSIASASTIATTAPNFQPDGLLVAAVGAVSANVVSNHGYLSLGAADGTVQRSDHNYERNGVSGTNASLYHNTAGIMGAAAAAGTSFDTHESFTSFDTLGFTLTQSTTASGRFMSYLAFNTGDPPAAGSPAASIYQRMLA